MIIDEKGLAPPFNRGKPWFDDGNVVLVTSGLHPLAFKVHRGVMARHSEVFQSMFEMPQPYNDYETFEGYQIVHMHDTPSELSNLVIALYDGVNFQTRNIDDFFFLAGILRLATKYFIINLRNQAIRHLAQTWAYTLNDHDVMVDRAIKSPIASNLTFPYVHPLHVFNLARETNVRIVIPSVLYFLSMYPLSDLLRGDHPKLSIEHPSRPSSHLSVEDMKEYTLMFQHRLDLILYFYRHFCGDRKAGADCANAVAVGDGGAKCTRAFAKLSSRLSRSWGPKTGPIYWQLQAVKQITEDNDVCKTCRKHFRDDINDLRDATWKLLPGVVGLPGWDELEKMDLSESKE